jgi:tetratricopeptide (TPR) repeat protein
MRKKLTFTLLLLVMVFAAISTHQEDPFVSAYRSAYYSQNLLEVTAALNLAHTYEQKGKTHYLRAWIHKSQDHHELAIDDYLTALKFYKLTGDEFQQANIYQNLGWTANHFGKAQQAKTYYTKAMVLFLETGKEKSANRLRYNIAANYFDIQRYDSTVSMLKTVIQDAKRFDDVEYIMRSYTYLGRCMEKLGENELARKHHLNSLDFYVEHYGQEPLGHIYDNLAFTAQQAGNFRQADNFYKIAAGNFEAVQLYDKVALVYSNQILLNEARDSVEGMRHYGEALLELLDKAPGADDIIEGLEIMQNHFAASGNTDKYIEFDRAADRARAYQDSITRVVDEKMSSKFWTIAQAKEEEFAKLQKSANLAHFDTRTTLIASLLFVTAALLFQRVRNYRKQRKQTKESELPICL